MRMTTTCWARAWQRATGTRKRLTWRACASQAVALSFADGSGRSPPSDPATALPSDLVRSVGRGNLCRNGLMRKHRCTNFAVDDVSLVTRRADVLVTHEATRVHQHGWGAVDALASSLRVRKSLHGHHHVCLRFFCRRVPRIEGHTPSWFNDRLGLKVVARCSAISRASAVAHSTWSISIPV